MYVHVVLLHFERERCKQYMHHLDDSILENPVTRKPGWEVFSLDAKDNYTMHL